MIEFLPVLRLSGQRRNNRILQLMIEFGPVLRITDGRRNTMGLKTNASSAMQDNHRTKGNSLRNGDGSILVSVTPAPGHVNPMLAIACHLGDRGYPVIFNTAEVFRKQVESEGLRFVPFTGKANFDYRTCNKFLPEGKTLKPGPEELIHNAKHVFGDTMLDQCKGIRDIMGHEPIGLILTDFTFFGILPLLVGPENNRPPIVSFGVSPVVLTSIDTSPMFGPATTVEQRERIREETRQFQARLACVNEYLDDLLRGYGCGRLPAFFLDCLYTMPDLFLQLTADAFEFPRTDLPSHLKFAGPVLPRSSSSARLPDWWKERDGSKPLVLVTQGTVANRNLDELIGPTLQGLSTEDVMVVATTGKPVEALTTPVPSNAKVIPFLPLVEALPEVDVFVTNGGFGAVNQALSMGVPIVVGGETEDKAFVAARVAWTGAGINLETSCPAPERVRSAVCEVLNDGSYRANARKLQKNFAQYDALDRITRHIAPFLAGPTLISRTA